MNPTTVRALISGCALGLASAGLAVDPVPSYEKEILPVLEDYCYDCHGEGTKKGGLAMDKYNSLETHLNDAEFWLAVWKNLDAQLMPPAEKPQPSPADRQRLLRWIETAVFKVDPANPDPGRVTVRRLNREEYRNTVFDLLGVEFEVDEAFPADDTGYGFDTIGDVLNLSPLLMEKYLDAAQAVGKSAIEDALPRIPTQTVSPDEFRAAGDAKKTAKLLPFAEPATVSHVRRIEHPGRYRLTVEMRVTGSMDATTHTAKVGLRVGDKTLETANLGWDYRKSIELTAEAELAKGDNLLALQVLPGNPPPDNENFLNLNVVGVRVHGPLDGSRLEYPKQYSRVFLDGPPPPDAAARTAYARRILRHFADRAFRRPADEPTLDRLVSLMRETEHQPGMNFERGVGHALTAIFASPRFLFRAETQPEPNNPGHIVPLDEFALASRLSYFLWSSLPDEELFALAQKGQLRANLRPQVDRMLADGRSRRLVSNFVGQWLQTRDVEGMNVDARRFLGVRRTSDAVRIFNPRVRRAMREETETLFAHLLGENRSVLELLTADYTFLNETLARFYGLDGVEGSDMRKVALPPDNPRRGGILTHGSTLLVTSNPTRTSPVKRGLFILDNILGTPAPPAPPNVPELEDSRQRGADLTMRELMEVHREKALCASCHARMDPLGLALENFNPLGQYRAQENGKPIDTAGKLITGEKFADAGELAKVLATSRRHDFFRCLSEKLLTYAIGRGLEYYDTVAVEQIVAGLQKEGGAIRSLIYGIVDSAPFQKRRGDGQRVADSTPHSR
ncbi:MAG: DUF1592 domain-containing protein [Verrucomicrobiota bacterium]|nr:DUF1592 domain-containing protein [Verrucomicrobiota bacterium]